MPTPLHTRWMPAAVTGGAVLFMILYVLAAQYYPGGSQHNPLAGGFSWQHNYWCNLLNDTAINGQPNTGKIFAMVAMWVLACTLALFWWQVAALRCFNKAGRLTVRISALTAAGISLLLLTGRQHDMVINLASLFAFIAVAATFYALHKNKWRGLFAFGIINLLLVGVNNVFYYTPSLLQYLPIIQKVTFVSFLLWICFVTTKVGTKQY
jgi:hypothetical protein